MDLTTTRKAPKREKLRESLVVSNSCGCFVKFLYNLAFNTGRPELVTLTYIYHLDAIFRAYRVTYIESFMNTIVTQTMYENMRLSFRAITKNYLDKIDADLSFSLMSSADQMYHALHKTFQLCSH